MLPSALGAPVPVREVGISASETFVGIPLSGGDDACAAWPLGEVLEWVADDGSVHGLWELDVGAEYRLVITGRHGLLRYDLGDVLRVVGRLGATPLLRFVRRAGQQLSATGEKLTESHLLAAMGACGARLGLGGAQFTLRLVLAERPWYELAIEAAPESVTALPALLDAELGRHNVEYASKRASGRLDPVRVSPLPPGTYAALRRRRVARGVPEGQYKHPSMALDAETWEALMGSTP
ncbi:MAG: GH3 auxin-responsive promoter family protein [Pseudomonadota bacterium]